jgi:hypothetical protein
LALFGDFPDFIENPINPEKSQFLGIFQNFLENPDFQNFLEIPNPEKSGNLLSTIPRFWEISNF